MLLRIDAVVRARTVAYFLLGGVKGILTATIAPGVMAVIIWSVAGVRINLIKLGALVATDHVTIIEKEEVISDS